MSLSFVAPVLVALTVLFQPPPAFAMSDGNRALMERRQAAEAEAQQSGQVPAEAPPGGSGPRGAGVAIAIVAALVIVGLIVSVAGPSIAFDEATSGYE